MTADIPIESEEQSSYVVILGLSVIRSSACWIFSGETAVAGLPLREESSVEFLPSLNCAIQLRTVLSDGALSDQTASRRLQISAPLLPSFQSNHVVHRCPVSFSISALNDAEKILEDHKRQIIIFNFYRRI